MEISPKVIGCVSWASVTAQLVKNLPVMRRPWFNSWVRKIPWRRDTLSTSVFLGFPCGSAHKESVRNARDLGPIPGLERSPGEGIHYPLQYSGLESSMDCIAHEVAKSPTWLCNFHFQHLWLKEESEPGFWSRCLACWLVAGRLGLLLSLPLMTHLCFPKLVKEAFRQPELLHLLLCKWLYNSNRLLR